MIYRWLTNGEIAEFVNPVCRQQGWAELNINEAQPTCRVMGALADDGVQIVGFFAMQLHPILGPAWVDSFHRDGTVSRTLTERMHEFLDTVEARGYLVVCDSPVSERLAQRHGMSKLESPVYIQTGG